MNDCLNSSLVLLASAGTGKTFALSNRFLELVANGVPVQNILATTFTRKAAGEILDRILARLAEAALSDSAFTKLLDHVNVPVGWSRTDAGILLRELLNNLHRFEVRTLDAWFQQSLQVVALELGLPPGWTIGDDFDLAELRAKAILEVIATLEPRQADGLLRDLQQREFKRSVFEGLLALLNEALTMHLNAGGRKEVWLSLSSCLDPDTEDLSAMDSALDAIKIPKTGKGTPNKSWQSNLNNLHQYFQDRNWKGVLDLGLIKAILEEKAKFGAIAITESVRDTLAECAKLAAMAMLAELHRSNVALCELVSAYAESYARLKRNAGYLDFDDIPRLLAASSHDLLARHRLGHSVKHLLLDEFQDTSVLQWQVLEPRIEQVVDDSLPGTSMLCVGDVKQAIYAWREGESDLLAGIPEWYGVAKKTMSENYRSSQKILDAVNLVFTPLGSRAPVIDDGSDDDLLTSIQDWADGFQKHVAAKDLPGSVWLLQCNAFKRQGSTPEVMRLLVDRVEDLHRQAPEASIGILVRRNKDIQTLLLELKRRGIRASGEGGNLLTDSEAVQVALSLFRLADHAGDTTAFFHIATSPLAQFFAASFNPNEKLGKGARRLSRFLRRRLLDDGCGKFLIDLAEFIEEQQLFDAWNRHRFGQLIAQGLQFEKRNELRVGRFVELIENTRVSDPLAAPVRIMTVHASKGLEFDAVLLPFFDTRGNPRNALISQRYDARRGFDLISLTPAPAIIPLAAPLKVMTASKIARDVQEELCVLYVAMTRARQRLEIIVPPQVKSSTVFRTEDLLRAALRDSFIKPYEIPNADVLWHNATQVAFEFTAAETSEASPASATLPASLTFQPATGKRALPRWSPSSTEGDGRTTGASLLSTSAAAARCRGTAIHRLFEEIAWLDNFHGNDQHLLHLLSECGYTGSAAMDLITSFRDALDQPAVRQLLMRPSKPGDCELWRELPFAVCVADEHGADSILNGIFDRVMLHSIDGHIVNATIIDFKTGAIAGELDLISKTDFYHSQMRAYRKALCVRTGLEPHQVDCKLLFVDAGLVADL